MKDFIISIKRAPLLFVLLPFMVGVFIARTGIYDNYVVLLVSLVMGVVLLIIFRKLKLTFNYLWGLMLILVSVTVGHLHFYFYQQNHKVSINTQHEYFARAVCLDSPQKTQYGYKCEMRVTHLGKEKPETVKPFKVLVYMNAHDSIHDLETGSNVMTLISFKKMTNRGNPHEFDYKGFQELQNIYYAGRIKPGNWILLPSQGLPLKRFAEQCREYFDENINMALFSDREKAILTAMCLGDKSNMEERTLTLFQRMGIAHLFAVSGLHVGFVFLLFQGLFGRIARFSFFTRMLSVLVSIVAIWLFTLITGLPESAIRASIMFSIIALGNLSDKKHYSVNNLALAAFIILLINPKQLFQIGFQLSFLAVLGILLFYNKINRWVYFPNYIGRKIWELVSISLSAQFFIFPLLLYHFHQFSFAFIFSNIIATPVSALLLYGGLLLNILSFIPFLKLIVGYLVKFVFSFFLLSLDAMKDVTWFFADNIYLTQLEFLVLMLLTVSTGWLMYFFRARWMLVSLTIALVFAFTNLWKSYNQANQSSFVVYNIPGSSTLSFVSGKNHFLLTDTTILRHPKKEDYYLSGNYLATGTFQHVVPLNIDVPNKFSFDDITINSREDNSWIQFRKSKILVLETPLSLKENYEVDVLIIRNYNKNSIAPFLANVKAKMLIFDNTAPFYRIDQWMEECEAANQPYHYTYEDGAYQLHQL